DIVRQGYNERLNFQLEQQITSYVRQEVAYKAYASYFGRADVARDGFQHFFHDSAKTARKLGLELTQLVNQRGGHVRYPVIQLKDACTHAIEAELAKGEITKPRFGQPGSARTEDLICQFLLLNRKDTSHQDKADRQDTRDRPERRDRWDKSDKTDETDKTDTDKLLKNKITGESRPSRVRLARIKRWTWSLFASDREDQEDQADQGDQATTTITVQSETSSQAPSAYKLDDRSSWLNGLFGLEDCLAVEKTAQQELLPIIAMTRKGNMRDPQIYHALRFNLDHHVMRTYRVAELVTRLQRQQDLDSYELEEFLLDKELEDDD
ncbi:hypothetical protein EGW08_008277, partial [Elysia chlorotica]